MFLLIFKSNLFEYEKIEMILIENESCAALPETKWNLSTEYTVEG